MLFLESAETPLFVQINVSPVRALRLDRKYTIFGNTKHRQRGKARNPKHPNRICLSGLVPELPLPSHGWRLWKDVPGSQKLGHLVPGNVPGNTAQTLILDHIKKKCVPRIFRPLLLSAVWGHTTKFLFQEFLALFPENFRNVPRNSSQELFPMSCGA